MPGPDHCAACEALYNECGPELWSMYSKKLLLRGWAGRLSQAERAYVRAHRQVSEKQQAHMQRMAAFRFTKKGTRAA
jgi:hypothetical protein